MRSLVPFPYPISIDELDALEDHVINGVFSPPLKDGGRSSPVHHRSRHGNRTLHNEVIPVSLFRYNAASKTFRTSFDQLRAHTFCSLITLHNAATGGSMKFELHRTTRTPSDWRSIEYKSTPEAEYRLIILNTDMSQTAPDDRPDIKVIRDGACWVAEFQWSERRKDMVKRVGFEYSPIEKRWTTQDPYAACVFDPELRAELARQRANPVTEQQRPMAGRRRLRP